MIVIIRQLWASSLLLGLHLLVDLDGLDVLVALESLDRVLGELDSKALDEVVLVGDLAALVLGVLLGGSDLLGGSTVLAGDNVARHLRGCFVKKTKGWSCLLLEEFQVVC